MNKLKKKNRKKYRIFRFMTYNQINELFNKNNLFLLENLMNICIKQI